VFFRVSTTEIPTKTFKKSTHLFCRAQRGKGVIEEFLGRALIVAFVIVAQGRKKQMGLIVLYQILQQVRRDTNRFKKIQMLYCVVLILADFDCLTTVVHASIT
jgi:hypothetical protein